MNHRNLKGFTGRKGKKMLLRVDTNLSPLSIAELNVEDRLRENGKMKGSLGSERFQVYISDEAQLNKFITFLQSSLTNP